MITRYSSTKIFDLKRPLKFLIKHIYKMSNNRLVLTRMFNSGYNLNQESILATLSCLKNYIPDSKCIQLHLHETWNKMDVQSAMHQVRSLFSHILFSPQEPKLFIFLHTKNIFTKKNILQRPNHFSNIQVIAMTSPDIPHLKLTGSYQGPPSQC